MTNIIPCNEYCPLIWEIRTQVKIHYGDGYLYISDQYWSLMKTSHLSRNSSLRWKFIELNIVHPCHLWSKFNTVTQIHYILPVAQCLKRPKKWQKVKKNYLNFWVIWIYFLVYNLFWSLNNDYLFLNVYFGHFYGLLKLR